MVRSGFAFHSLPTPRAWEKCIARAKARRDPKVAELIDLYWDGGRKDGSLDQAASVPLPAAWYGASFLAHERGYVGMTIMPIKGKWKSAPAAHRAPACEIPEDLSDFSVQHIHLSW